MEKIVLTPPLDNEKLKKLKIGDTVYITGTIYTARDAAHKRLVDLIAAGEELPIDLAGQIIYYAGPAPNKPGKPIGSIGPTTSYRMDAYAPTLMRRKGLKGMIGKGKRSDEVKQAMKETCAVYFGATGGAAALLSQCVKSAEVILYPELGPEAVRRLEVEDFPVTVINDVHGNDLYEAAIEQYNTENV
ncbi:MAG TPA: Fe-S-containing hydro-lyase [Firmicutes bacterium]|nr:Fe-S-containing hydro-lyase [Bacillota bacterium]